MVSRVYGKANGKTIFFTPREGDRWEATVPWTQDGEYVVELSAEDAAGNTGYLCTMLFVISGHEMQGYVVPRGFSGNKNTHDYAGLLKAGEYLCNIRGNSLSAEFGRTKYRVEVKEGGYKIEHTVCSRDVYGAWGSHTY